MGLVIKDLNDAITVTKDDGTKVAYYLFNEYEIHINTIPPGTEQVWHYHQNIEEVILVIDGSMEVHYLDNQQKQKQVIYINQLVQVKDSIHTFINNSNKDCKFIVFRLVLDHVDKSEIIKNDKKLYNFVDTETK